MNERAPDICLPSLAALHKRNGGIQSILPVRPEILCLLFRPCEFEARATMALHRLLHNCRRLCDRCGRRPLELEEDRVHLRIPPLGCTEQVRGAHKL